MNENSAFARKKLKQYSSVKDFEDLVNQTMLSDEEKQIVMLHYRDKKTLSYIADVIGLSESSVKKKHQQILEKMFKMF